MMKKSLLLVLGVFTLSLIGCSGEGDSGNVEAGIAASKQAEQTARELPKDMPPEARRSAENAIAAQKAMTEHMQRNAPPKLSPR
jgi:hypothetical protein